MSSCIACGNPQIKPYYNPGPQPLAALNLPRTREQARRILQYPMDFHACLRCGHIFNVAFDVAQVPYTEDSNLMYNSGAPWGKHLDDVVSILRDENRAEGKTVLDIGAGDGLLLDKLNRTTEGTRCIAFEPGVEAATCRQRGLETYADYFIPDRDMETYKPDIMVCRHVLEHLENPRELVSDIARCACQLDQIPLFFVEVPCIEKGLRHGRVGDFLYEHVSNFTERSLCMMMESCGWYSLGSRLAYNDEVIFWVGEPNTMGYREPPKAFDLENIQELVAFVINTYEDDFVFWGGTGKGAAFLNAIKAPPDTRVVDSDVRKAGRYVPGTGQLIEPASNLHKFPVQAVLVTTRWRAADIYQEIKQHYPCVEAVLVVEGNIIRQYMEEDYVKETS